MFITFEGTDGVGKSTHIRLLAAWLKKQGHKVLMTREPGGGPLSEKIRSALLDVRFSISAETELLLYLAARSEHVDHVIVPALRKKHIVLCDRFSDATVAYQGFGRGLDLKKIKDINQFATKGLIPNLTLWLDYPVKEGLARARKAKQGKIDRIEKEGALFLRRVRQGYHAISKQEPQRFVRILVADQVEKTQLSIRKEIAKRCSL